MSIIKFSREDMANLADKDEKMAKVIGLIGDIERKGYDDIFIAIIDSMISQQLSRKVADMIIDRLHQLLDNVTPENILCAPTEELKSVGLSERKVRYIKGVATSVSRGILDVDKLIEMNDNEVIDKLIALDGIGHWTAQMLLIFALGRRDVLSYKDLGIRKGLTILYGDNYDFDEIYKRFSPYNTLASFYLWEMGARAKT